MNFSKFRSHYWTHDGLIKSFRLDISNNIVEIELSVRKMENGKALPNQIDDNEMVPCSLRLTFHELIEVSVFDRFPTDGYYLEFITSYDSNGREVSLSINLFDSSNYVYEKPNWVIRSKTVSWQEI